MATRYVNKKKQEVYYKNYDSKPEPEIKNDERITRHCMNCLQKFIAESRFLRRCKNCRTHQ